MARVFSGKKFLFESDVAGSFHRKLLGIMFQNTPIRKQFAKPLLFAFRTTDPVSNSIHSLFCFTDFDAVFLDEGFKATGVVSRIKPWQLLITPKKPCKYLLELPAGWAARYKIKVGTVLRVAGL